MHVRCNRAWPIPAPCKCYWILSTPASTLSASAAASPHSAIASSFSAGLLTAATSLERLGSTAVANVGAAVAELAAAVAAAQGGFAPSITAADVLPKALRGASGYGVYSKVVGLTVWLWA